MKSRYLRGGLGAAAALLLSGASSTGCAGCLGLDGKIFETTGGGGTGGAADSTTNTGFGGLIITNGTSKETAFPPSTGTGATGTGAGGCGPLAVNDEFAYPNGTEAAELVDACWNFTWQKEPYPDPKVYPGTFVYDGQFNIALNQTFYWFNGVKGALMYREIEGDFLVVADVLVKQHMTDDPPLDDQAGAGIMVRDPASGDFSEDFQRWISVDRGVDFGVPSVHGSWSTPAESWSFPDSTLPHIGKIAMCRVGTTFSIWTKESDNWTDRSADLLMNVPGDEMPAVVQVGLIAYAYNPNGVGNPSPAGIIGRFDYVHQYDPAGVCDPSAFGE